MKIKIFHSIGGNYVLYEDYEKLLKLLNKARNCILNKDYNVNLAEEIDKIIRENLQ